jgi:hypothetical protein
VAHWEGPESDSEEESDCEYTDEEGYLSEGDLDLYEDEVTGKEDCETNADAFQKMMKTTKNRRSIHFYFWISTTAKNRQDFYKVKFRCQTGLELGQKQKQRKTKQINQLRQQFKFIDGGLAFTCLQLMNLISLLVQKTLDPVWRA